MRRKRFVLLHLYGAACVCCYFRELLRGSTSRHCCKKKRSIGVNGVVATLSLYGSDCQVLQLPIKLSVQSNARIRRMPPPINRCWSCSWNRSLIQRFCIFCTVNGDRGGFSVNWIIHRMLYFIRIWMILTVIHCQMRLNGSSPSCDINERYWLLF